MAYRQIGSSWNSKMREDIDLMFIELYKEYTGAGLDATEAKEKSLQAVADALIAKEDAATAKEMVQQIIDGEVDTGALVLEIERKLNELESQYAPDLNGLKTEVGDARGSEATLGDNLNSIKTDLAQNEKEISTVKHKKVYVEDYEKIIPESDDTGRIMRAFNNLNDFDTFVISGDYMANNLVFDKSDITIEYTGRIRQPADKAGTLLQLGSETKRTRRIKVEGMIKLYRDISETILPQEWHDKETYGLRTMNLYESQIEIGTIERFKRGLILGAVGSNGTVYNKIFINRIINNQENIRLESDELGWVNNNEFYGGSLLWSSGVIAHPEGKIETIPEAIERLGTFDVNITDLRMNNNVFYGTAMDTPMRDGEYLASGTFIKNEGRYNKFFGVRLEGNALKVHNGPDSSYNEYNPAFLVGFEKGAHYIEEGSRNKIYGRDFTLLEGNEMTLGRMTIKQSTAQLSNFTSEDALIDLQSLSSNADKLLIGRDVAGKITSYIDAVGNMELDRSVTANRGGTFKPTTNSNQAISVQSTEGTNVFSVNGEGLISGAPKFPVLPSLPNAALNRGRFLRIEGGSGIEDKIYISVKKADDNYGWLQLSGSVV